MALKNKNIGADAEKNAGKEANSAFIKAVYKEKFGRQPTAKELQRFSGKTVKYVSDIVLGKDESPYYNISVQTTPETTPEEEVTKKVLTDTERAQFEKESYHSYVRDYGIEIPQLTEKYGLPEGYDPTKTQWGLQQASTQAGLALTPQQLADQLAIVEQERKGALNSWEALKTAILNGELDAASDEATSLARNLEQKTMAIDTTRRSLAAKGTLYGGLAQRRTTEAEQPYLQQEADIRQQKERAMRDFAARRTTGQTDYDIAMEQYLTGKKSNISKYGIEQGAGSGTGLEYGAGTWNPQTGQFENIRWGAGPTELGANEVFFGSDPYSLIQKQQQRRSELESTMRQGIAQGIANREYDWLNS